MAALSPAEAVLAKEDRLILDILNNKEFAKETWRLKQYGFTAQDLKANDTWEVAKDYLDGMMKPEKKEDENAEHKLRVLTIQLKLKPSYERLKAPQNAPVPQAAPQNVAPASQNASVFPDADAGWLQLWKQGRASKGALPSGGFLPLPELKLNGVPKRLFVRDCYGIFFDLLMNEQPQPPTALLVRFILIRGTPGIGKSLFVLYCLHRSASCGKVVRYRNKDLEDDLMFHPDGQVHAVPRKAALDCDILFLDGTADGLIYAKSLVVEVSSPRQQNYEAFTKAAASGTLGELYMPLWSLNELITLNQELPDVHAAITTLFKVFGGSARHVQTCLLSTVQPAISVVPSVFTSTQAALDNILDSVFAILKDIIAASSPFYRAVHSTLLRSLTRMDSKVSGSTLDTEAISSTFIHWHVATDFCSYSPLPASKFTAILMQEYFEHREFATLSKFVQIAGYEAQTWYFEAAGHRAILGATIDRPFTLRPLNAAAKSLSTDLSRELGPTKVLQINSPKLVIFEGHNALADVPAGCYAMPHVSNLPAIDSALDDVMFQFTTSIDTRPSTASEQSSESKEESKSSANAHAINRKGLDDAIQAIGKNHPQRKPILVFVLPSRDVERFAAQVDDSHKPVDDVPQFKMEIDVKILRKKSTARKSSSKPMLYCEACSNKDGKTHRHREGHKHYAELEAAVPKTTEPQSKKAKMAAPSGTAHIDENEDEVDAEEEED